MFHDFYLSIVALDDDLYQLQLEVAIAPELEPITEVVTWRPETWLVTWHDYPLETWGQMLAAALFVGDIRDQWEDTVAIAEADHGTIQFSLGLPPGILWFLPWEAIFMGKAWDFVHFSRHWHSEADPDSEAFERPLLPEAETPWSEKEASDFAEDTAFIQDIFAKFAPDQTKVAAANPVAVAPSEAPQTVGWRQFFSQHRRSLAIGFTVAIACGGIFIGRQLHPPVTEASLSPGITQLTGAELAQLEISKLQQLAATEMQQANWGNVQTLVAQLLERQAFTEAQSVLFDEAIAPNNGTIAFLRGRYLWQMAAAETSMATTKGTTTDQAIATAAENWQQALNQRPDDPEILMALGFFHYRQGEYEAANNLWYEALATVATDPDFPPTPQAQMYAGLALSMYHLAQAETDTEQEILLSKAAKLRAIALDLDAEHLKPRALADQWLWFPEAIATWQTLLGLDDIS
ncbi:tetratricopeptide repeat protein [Synechococcus moorigangaii CMS01]|nr:tetratricopeptide repeat protein [Synechococcus moorigangaii CMS01]